MFFTPDSDQVRTVPLHVTDLFTEMKVIFILNKCSSESLLCLTIGGAAGLQPTDKIIQDKPVSVYSFICIITPTCFILNIWIIANFIILRKFCVKREIWSFFLREIKSEWDRKRDNRFGLRKDLWDTIIEFTFI